MRIRQMKFSIFMILIVLISLFSSNLLQKPHSRMLTFEFESKPIKSSAEMTPNYKISTGDWIVYKTVVDNRFQYFSKIFFTLSTSNTSLTLDYFQSNTNPETLGIKDLDFNKSVTLTLDISNIMSIFWVMPTNFNYTDDVLGNSSIKESLWQNSLEMWNVPEGFIESDIFSTGIENNGTSGFSVLELFTNSSILTKFHYINFNTFQINLTTRIVQTFTEVFQRTRICDQTTCAFDVIVRKTTFVSNGSDPNFTDTNSKIPGYPIYYLLGSLVFTIGFVTFFLFLKDSNKH